MSNPPAQWVDMLREHKLPGLNDNIQHCSSIVEADSPDLVALAAIIRRDPGLLCLFLRHVNEGRRDSARPLVSTIESALDQLNTEEIQSLLGQSSSVEDLNQNKAFQRLWLSLILRSYHAGRLAQILAEENGERAPAEVYTAGFLCNIGEFCLAVADPDKFIQLNRQQKTRPRKQCEMELLGCYTNDIGGVLASRWGLPQLLQDTFNKTLKLSQRAQPCTISQDIAYEADVHGWDSEPMQFCYAQAADILRTSPGSAAQKIHSDSAQIAREYIIPGFTHAAVKLVQIPGEIPDESEVPGKQASSGHAKDRQAPSGALLLQARQIFNKARQEGASHNELIRLILRNLLSGFGFQRALLMLSDQEYKSLSIRAAPGFSDMSIVGKPLPWLEDKGLFARAIEKPQLVWINDERFRQFAQALPDEFTRLTQSSHFLLITLALNGKPRGIIYTDLGGRALDKALLVEVNKAAVVYNQALTPVKSTSPA